MGGGRKGSEKGDGDEGSHVSIEMQRVDDSGKRDADDLDMLNRDPNDLNPHLKVS